MGPHLAASLFIQASRLLLWLRRLHCGILCLPLILLLVYKQRQVASNRRECPRLPGLGGV